MKILVADDSMVYRKTVVKYLKTELPDVKYLTAANGEEALLIYKDEEPDYIFLDLLMPKLNGQEVLKRIRGIDTEVGVVVLTADVQKMVKEEIEELGVLKFINKPFSPDKAAEIAKEIRGDYDVE